MLLEEQLIVAECAQDCVAGKGDLGEVRDWGVGAPSKTHRLLPCWLRFLVQIVQVEAHGKENHDYLRES